MTRYTTTSSRPCNSVSPRPQSGLSREWVNGPLQPMEEESQPARFSRWFAYAALAFAGAIALYHVARAIHGLNLWWLI